MNNTNDLYISLDQGHSVDASVGATIATNYSSGGTITSGGTLSSSGGIPSYTSWTSSQKELEEWLKNSTTSSWYSSGGSYGEPFEVDKKTVERLVEKLLNSDETELEISEIVKSHISKHLLEILENEDSMISETINKYKRDLEAANEKIRELEHRLNELATRINPYTGVDPYTHTYPNITDTMRCTTTTTSASDPLDELFQINIGGIDSSNTATAGKP